MLHQNYGLIFWCDTVVALIKKILVRKTKIGQYLRGIFSVVIKFQDLIL